MPASTRLLATAVETTPGTWASPSWATGAFPVMNLRISPFQSTPLRREVDLPYAGSRPSAPSQIHRGIAFDWELAGSGTANTPVAWQSFLRAAMFGAGVPGGSAVTYPLTSAGDGAALSVIAAMGPFAHESRMARGTITFSFIEKQLPRASFDGLALLRTAGVIQAPVDLTGLALPSPPAPVEVNVENTLIRLDAFTLGVREAVITLNMKTQLYSTTGERSIVFGKDQDGDRRNARFRVVFELPDLGSKNYASSITAGTLLAFTIVHGTAAGNIIEIGTPSAQIESFTIEDVDNRTMATMEGVLVPTGAAGNNELSLVTK
ncbi:MAG: hypothetical protein KGQ52_13830 [Alphaproteobacteria bacterium]|nr:hypothetical protein [Alphaproteobacteria bacterium]